MVSEDLLNRFKYHPPLTPERRTAHEDIRAFSLTLASHIDELCPEGREKSLAITKVEEAMMWANAAIARQKD